jgi:MoxR-like ATPase
MFEEDKRMQAIQQKIPVHSDTRMKLRDAEKELNAEVLERESEVRSLILAHVAGEHILLLESPGTAKSAL